MKLKRISGGLLAAGAAITIAGCGSSTAKGVMLAPSGQTADAVSTVTATTTTATTTTATTTTASVKTPTSGALSREPVFSVPSGAAPTKLVVKDLIVGTGATVKAGDTVWANYVGKFYSNGKVFDASWNHDPAGPSEFTLATGGVIEGWVKGLVGMRVGGRRELIIPPSLGYGNSTYEGIPGKSTLVFVVDMIKIAK